MKVFAILSNELVELVKTVCEQRAETQTLECKAAHTDCPKRLYDTLSSFSNQDSGGVLLFGIDEKAGFQVVGVYDLQDLQKKVTEQCTQMEPPVRAVFTVAEVDGRWICAAEIPAIDLSERPCYYRGAGRSKGSYIRVGDADLPMTDYELYTATRRSAAICMMMSVRWSGPRSPCWMGTSWSSISSGAGRTVRALRSLPESRRWKY